MFKFAVGKISGSIGVFSEAIHSLLDVVSAAIAFITVREAGKPADDDHPFGHGKIETLSSLFESLLLVLAAGFILAEAWEHLRNPTPVTHQGLAIFTIVVSMVVSYWAYRHNLGAASETESSAIHVNALHFFADVVASAGVLLGLVLMRLTGWTVIDPLMAVGVAVYIVAISAVQVKRALQELSDTQLPDSEVRALKEILDEFKEKTIEAHDLRTRKSGSIRHIDFHLVTCGHLSVAESHGVCDEMEERITQSFPRSSVNIHVEPCEHERAHCPIDCPYGRRFKGDEKLD